MILKLARKDGGSDELRIYDVSSFPYGDLSGTYEISAKGKGHEKIAYLTDFMTFDIETTTLPGRKDKKGDYVITPSAFMWHWQACMGGFVIFGRRWEEFRDFLERIREALHLKPLKRLVIYVHNLGFEWAFLYPFIYEWYGDPEIFATQPHQPVKVTLEDWGIELRCSWKLSNMNLFMFTKTEPGCPYEKAWGDLDYKKVRTAATPITEEEAAYNAIDVLGLYYAMKSKLRGDRDSVASVPLTSTGYPRRICRRACRKDPDYREKCFKKCKISPFIYALLKEAGRGGDTHASRFFAGRIYTDCDSYDEVSEYPAAMLLYDYPMEAFSRYGDISSIEELEELCEKRAVLFRVTFEGLRIRKDQPMPYLPIDKCTSHTGAFRGDNGRILSCDGICCFTLTELDYKLVKTCYEWDGMMAYDVCTARKAPLPEPIRKTILGFFEQKCILKKMMKVLKKEMGEKPTPAQIDRYNLLEYKYGKTKNLLNGIFGMIYTDPVRSSCTMGKDGSWKEAIPEGEDVESLLAKYYRSRNSFLCYAWGVWVTAYGRTMLRELQACTVDPSGHSWLLYSDTDSAKSLYWDQEKLSRLISRQKALCDERGAFWEDPDTKERYRMGYPELDGSARRFVTLGAKKYAYEDEKGLLHVTVSGVANTHAPGDPMGAGARELMERGGIEYFTPGFIFRKAGGSCVWYGHEDPHYIKVKGCSMLTASYAAILNGDYTLGVTEEYRELLGCL